MQPDVGLTLDHGALSARVQDVSQKYELTLQPHCTPNCTVKMWATI
jgi:hypothetical protein